MVRLIESGDNWRVDIIDTGIGMCETDTNRMKVLFGQADEGYRRKYDGLGIGINLVESIVRAHGGRMSVQSKVDHGTCVSLHVPKLKCRSNTQTVNNSAYAA